MGVRESISLMAGRHHLEMQLDFQQQTWKMKLKMKLKTELRQKNMAEEQHLKKQLNFQ